jgi:hypothetical protein
VKPAAAHQQFSAYDYFCLVAFVFDLLVVATFEDVNYLLTAVSENRHSKERVKQLTSILIGSNYLKSKGQYGHFKSSVDVREIVEVRTGWANELTALRLEILSVIQNSSLDFRKIARIA